MIVTCFRRLVCITALLGFLCSTGYAIELNGWVVFGDKDDPQISISMEEKTHDLHLELDKTRNTFSLERGGSNEINRDAHLSALQKYYLAVINNKIDELAKMHDFEDGSRERFDRSINSKPDKFAGYKNIDRISIDKSFYWGEYVATHVRLYQGTDLLTPWTLLFHCSKYVCKLSDRLFNQDETFSFFAAAVSSFSADKEIAFEPRQEIYFGDKLTYPIGIKVNFDNFLRNTERYEEISREKKQSDKEDGQFFDLDISYRAFVPVEQFIKEVWKLDDENLVKFDKDNYDKSKYIIASLYEQYWGKEYVERLILNYKEVSNNSGGDSKEITPSFSAYSATALFQLVSNWGSVKPISFISDSEHAYIWVLATYENGDTGLFLFAVNKSESSLEGPDSTIAGIMMSNQIFAEAIDSEMKEVITSN